jgi:hypothetical protein
MTDHAALLDGWEAGFVNRRSLPWAACITARGDLGAIFLRAQMAHAWFDATVD